MNMCFSRHRPPSFYQSKTKNSGYTLVEVMLAVGIFSVTLLGYVAGLSEIRRQNRSLSQRELVASQSREVLELIKNMEYNNIRYSPSVSDRISLKWDFDGDPLDTNGDGTPDWVMPIAPSSNPEWFPMIIEDYVSGASADFEHITKTLLNAQWSANIQRFYVEEDGTVNTLSLDHTISMPAAPAGDEPNWEYKQINLTFRWDNGRRTETFERTIYISPDFTWL